MKVTIENIDAAVAAPYAWPGGYPTLYVMRDGGTICAQCAQDNKALIKEAMLDGYDDQWVIDAQEIVFENTEGLYCDNCDAIHEAAYGDTFDALNDFEEGEEVD